MHLSYFPFTKHMSELSSLNGRIPTLRLRVAFCSSFAGCRFQGRPNKMCVAQWNAGIVASTSALACLYVCRLASLPFCCSLSLFIFSLSLSPSLLLCLSLSAHQSVYLSVCLFVSVFASPSGLQSFETPMHRACALRAIESYDGKSPLAGYCMVHFSYVLCQHWSLQARMCETTAFFNFTI